MASQNPANPSDKAKTLAACADRFKCKDDLYRYLTKQQVSPGPAWPFRSNHFL